jgi:hypothetical protein
MKYVGGSTIAHHCDTNFCFRFWTRQHVTAPHDEPRPCSCGGERFASRRNIVLTEVLTPRHVADGSESAARQVLAATHGATARRSVFDAEFWLHDTPISRARWRHRGIPLVSGHWW